MSGGIRIWPDGDGIGRVIDKLEKIDPDGTWEEVWIEAIAVYLNVPTRTVRQQIGSRRGLRKQRAGSSVVCAQQE